MTDSLNSHRDVIDRWPSLKTFSEDIGKDYGTAKKMRQRNSIPVEHWPVVIAAATRREIDGVTYESLALMNAAAAKASEPARATP